MANLFQHTKDKAKHGAKAPWSVKWRDPDGRQRTKRVGSKTHAKNFKAKIESELSQSLYTGIIPKSWPEFRKELKRKELHLLKPSTQETYRIALDNFERIIHPDKMAHLNTRVIDDYRSKRSKEKGIKGGVISAATVNNELRTLRAVLKHAKRWNYVQNVPEFRFIKEPERIPRYVTVEHFEAIYGACHVATRPTDLPYDAPTWWRAFLIFQWMTGWRRSEPLHLLTSELDLETGEAITLAEDNKGNRDDRVPLHPVVVEHLQGMKSFRPEVFPWDLSSKALYTQYYRIQAEAGIELQCREKHDHTESCKYYGFHDLRRSFASVTAGQVDAKLLQKLMRHKDYSTTLRYINSREQLRDVTETFVTPNLARLAE